MAMAASENVGSVSRLHLSFKRIVERSHDMIYCIPRQPVNSEGYVADILEASREFKQLTHTLPDEVNNWTDDKFEEAFREAQRLDAEASDRLEKLVSQAENLQSVVRDKIHKTCKLMCGPVLQSPDDVNPTLDSTCKCGQRFRSHAKFCGHCGLSRLESKDSDDMNCLGETTQTSKKSLNTDGLSEHRLGNSFETFGSMSEAAKSSLPQPLLRELKTDQKRRFQEELEFVLLLADVRYVNWLALQGYLQNEAFISFLRYLLYWQDQPYVQWIIYPQCLRMLRMLQDPLFREKVKLSIVCDWLVRQKSYRLSLPEEVEPTSGHHCSSAESAAQTSCNRTLPRPITNARCLPKAFNDIDEPDMSKWSSEPPTLSKRCATHVLDYWERITRQKHLENRKGVDDYISEEYHVKGKMEKVRTWIAEWGDVPADADWQQMLLPFAGSRTSDQSELEKLCAELPGKSRNDGQRIEDENASLVSVAASKVSNISNRSKGSASSGVSKNASKDGVLSVISSGDGRSDLARASSSTDRATRQAEVNASSAWLHGEWVVAVSKTDGSGRESVWGKAYVSSDMSYLIQRKTDRKIKFTVSGDGTELSPYVLKSRAQEPATLVERSSRSLVWKLANGKNTRWTRP